jgi:hypothetical protein
MCTTLRPAGAIVHDEARGEDVGYSASAVRASLPAGSASADGEHRRHIRRHQQRGEGGGARQGGAGAVRRRAECTWLSPASYAAEGLCVTRYANSSAACFGVSLHARGRCGFRFGCAAQRSVTRGRSGRPRRRRAAAAPRYCRNSHWPRHNAAAWTCTADGRRGLGRRTHADSPQAETAHPSSPWAFTTAPDATSNRRIRRLPPYCAA